MKSAIAFTLFITAAQAFNAPMMATRAVNPFGRKKAAPEPVAAVSLRLDATYYSRSA